ncbi:MAG: 4a-hydroxytetrahydrobiopterin dehydratase [Acidimicrobiales bacterium]
MVRRLSEEELLAGLDRLPGWESQGGAIVKTFELGTFADAVAFVTRVGFAAEAADHHPDLDLRYRKVRVSLTTHDAGGLTARDLELAGEIESLVRVWP